MTIDAKGKIPESWNCVDCGINTAPGVKTRAEMEQAFKGKQSVNIRVTPQSEIYTVRASVWKQAGMEPMGGCLCIGCLERRIGRQLTPKDFMRKHPFNRFLMSRRDDHIIINHADGVYAVIGGNAIAVKTIEEAAEVLSRALEDISARNNTDRKG
jgi:hypothetical protein